LNIFAKNYIFFKIGLNFIEFSSISSDILPFPTKKIQNPNGQKKSRPQGESPVNSSIRRTAFPFAYLDAVPDAAATAAAWVGALAVRMPLELKV